MPFEPAVSSTFASVKAKWEGVQADNGQGVQGEWPPEGDHDCYVLDINAEQNQKFKDGDKGDLPAIGVVFQYQMLDAMPDKPADDRLEWRGSRFLIPLDESRITTDGNKMQWDISKRRLKGHVEAILGRTVSDPLSALQEVSEKISSQKVACKVRVSYREGKLKPGSAPGTKPPVYKTEHLLESISR